MPAGMRFEAFGQVAVAAHEAELAVPDCRGIHDIPELVPLKRVRAAPMTVIVGCSAMRPSPYR